MKTLARTSLALVASLGIAAATAVGPAWAQPEPGGGPGMMGGGPQQRWEQMQQRHTQRMQQLEKDLKLHGAAQQDAWKAFIEAHDAWIQAMHKNWQSLRGANTTPERFDKMVASVQENLPNLQNLAQKAHALYDTLDAQQKATLDRFTARPSRFNKGKEQNQ